MNAKVPMTCQSRQESVTSRPTSEFVEIYCNKGIKLVEVDATYAISKKKKLCK